MTSFRIHPAIGIGRIGNAVRGDSEGAGWYLGPERPGVPPGWNAAEKSYRDFKSVDGILAQGVRFRIFQYGDGNKPEELAIDGTGNVSHVEWTVELANRKAAFFKFCGPIGQGTLYGSLLHQLPFLRRNWRIPLSERESKLVLSSDPVKIESNERGTVKELANRHAETSSKISALGDMRVDEAGRLIVCGGYGHSVFLQALTRTPRDKSLVSYANNNGWFDDIADGPVSAVIHFKDGSTANVDGADGGWFVSAPPDFAPAVPPVRSLWDTLMDVFIRSCGQGLLQEPMFQDTHWIDLARAWQEDSEKLSGFDVSFVRDIQPMLEAAARIPGVFSMGTRPMAHARLAPEFLARLGGTNSENDARLALFAKLRAPGTRAYDPSEMPLSHGDFLPVEPGGLVRRLLNFLVTRLPVLPRPLFTLSQLQFALLKRWAAGEFEADWSPETKIVNTSQPITAIGLDQAALQHGVGGAFFPGIEASWLILNPSLYARPFRLHRDRVLQSSGATGPIIVRAGFLTAQMALPWQADFASCAKTAGITDPTNVAWWPSQRPDDVFFKKNGSLVQRRWAPAIDSLDDENGRHFKMVDTWMEQGFVIEEDGFGLVVRDE